MLHALKFSDYDAVERVSQLRICIFHVASDSVFVLPVIAGPDASTVALPEVEPFTLGCHSQCSSWNPECPSRRGIARVQE